MSSPILNREDVTFVERGDGEGFVFKAGRVGPQIGLAGLGCAPHILPPGKAAYPLHRHHVADEIFYVISGTGQYRHGSEHFPLRAGDIIGAPAGGEAHQILNTGAEDLHYLAISTMPGSDVIEYPNTGKVAVRAGIKGGDRQTATYNALGYVSPADYYDGEEPTPVATPTTDGVQPV